MKMGSTIVRDVFILLLAYQKALCDAFLMILPSATNHHRSPQVFADTTSYVDANNIFWNDSERVSGLPDPPSLERLALIQEKPYKGGFEPAIDVPAPYSPSIVYGSIPTDLVGTLASNGPGRIRVRDTQYGHWFDGDGYISVVSLDGRTNTATFNGNFIRSGRFQAQQQLMDKLRETNSPDLTHPPLAFLGAWTKKGRGRWFENIGRSPTNPANTATVWLESSSSSTSVPKLFALCEGGNPIQLDPRTLDVKQEGKPFTSCDGSKKVRSFFSAHFQRCPLTGDIYNHGFLIRPGPLPKEMNLIKLKADGSLLHQATSPLPFDCLVHDSAMTSNYMVFFLPPYYIPTDSALSLISGTATLGSLLEWHPEEKSYVQINSKDNLQLKWRIELPNQTSFYHFVDAFEEEEKNDDGSHATGNRICLKVRVAEHEPLNRIALEEQFADQYRFTGDRVNSRLKEFTFHLDRDTGEGRFVSKQNVADDVALCEYPTVNAAYRPSKRRRFCWTNALSDPSMDWLNGIQKVDMENAVCSRVVTFGPGSYAGPPTFVPKEAMAAEDDGFVLTHVYRSWEHRSDVVVLNAATLETICIMELRTHLPFQFHGDYVPGYTFDSMN